MPHIHPLTESDLDRLAPQILAVVEDVRAAEVLDAGGFERILRRHPRDGRFLFSKNTLVQGYRHLCRRGELPFEEATLRRLQMKPVRTISGVAPVTVLTRPHPCPGRCVFCPTDARMPKSYLHDEPGARRAEQHAFDPFRQTASRIRAFESNGHAVDKIELLILGGTWSSYPRSYQRWFVRRCLEAMNADGNGSANGETAVGASVEDGFAGGGATERGAREAVLLERAQTANESARHRNVGLVIETRPDHVTPREVRWLREMGVTKVQMGAQSLDDRILALNQRGHPVERTAAAMTLLRSAGFKLVLHWMPNLLGATPDSDRRDFMRLWENEGLRPDEIKIYPCSLLRNAQLYQFWERGEYHPYDDEMLVALIADVKRFIPPYCRVNRVYRDIPAPNIVAGSRMSNMRQAVRAEMRRRGERCGCIRCREVRGRGLDAATLDLRGFAYRTRTSEEHFLSFDDAGGALAGYLRLSLPDAAGPVNGDGAGRGATGALVPELRGAALVREVHVYGPALALGGRNGSAQHLGLGTRLLARAEEIAAAAGYSRVAVIASVGTRPYYAGRGYVRQGTYMVKERTW